MLHLLKINVTVMDYRSPSKFNGSVLNCWQISSRKEMAHASFPSINMCGYILKRFTAKQTNTVDGISISLFPSLVTFLWVFQPSLLFCFVCSLLVFRPAFHHPSHCKAEYEIIPFSAPQRASFSSLWMIQLYQYCQTVGCWTLIRMMIYDFAEILLRSALRFHQWALFSCPTQQVSNAGNSGKALMPDTNTDCSFLPILPSCSLSLSNYWNYPRCPHSAPVNSVSANSLPEQSTH